jgi:uncharacterized protein (DUF302 family)
MKNMISKILFILALINTPILYAGDHIIKTKTPSAFEDTVDLLEVMLEKKGYNVAHEQHCDGGLRKMGYERGSYSVLFFGKLEQIRELSSKHDALIPFLPLKVAVYEDGDGTQISFLNPHFMKVIVEDDPQLDKYINQWEKDFLSIVEDTKDNKKS